MLTLKVTFWKHQNSSCSTVPTKIWISTKNKLVTDIKDATVYVWFLYLICACKRKPNIFRCIFSSRDRLCFLVVVAEIRIFWGQCDVYLASHCVNVYISRLFSKLDPSGTLYSTTTVVHIVDTLVKQTNGLVQEDFTMYNMAEFLYLIA